MPGLQSRACNFVDQIRNSLLRGVASNSHYALQQFGPRMSPQGQMHALPRRSIAVRFTPNEQTSAGRVECGAMCHGTKSLRDSQRPSGQHYPQGRDRG